MVLKGLLIPVPSSEISKIPIPMRKIEKIPYIVQEEKGGYRHPTREFTGIGDFGQFRGADSEFRCYTEN